MKYNYLPVEIQKRVKKPFVFVTYCHDDTSTYDRVQELVSYLRRQNINIVYDEGGLAPGVDLIQFENLILSDNCKRVLVVSDRSYLYKVKNQMGGVWREYFNMSNEYDSHIDKYVPLVVDTIIPIFTGKIYIPFKDNNEFNNIASTLIDFKFVNDNRVKSKINIDKLFNDASELCDKGNYSAAWNKVNQAIDLYMAQNRIVKANLSKLYNLKLAIGIYKADIEEISSIVNKLKTLISGANRIDAEKRAVYFGNCALAYRMINKNGDEYEECAKRAYTIVRKYGIDDDGYYACLYSTALYDTQQYSAAYKIANEALEEFEKVHGDKTNYSKNDYIMYAKIKGNIAEIAIANCESINGRRNEKIDLLLDAQAKILDIINLKQLEYEDAIKAEIYAIATMVFKTLSKYYNLMKES